MSYRARERATGWHETVSGDIGVRAYWDGGSWVHHAVEKCTLDIDEDGYVQHDDWPTTTEIDEALELHEREMADERAEAMEDR